MTEEATRAAVTDLYAAYGRRDFDRVASLIDDDVDWIIYGPMQVFPFAGHRRGKVAVLEALGGIAKDYMLESYVPRVMVVDGDNVRCGLQAVRDRSHPALPHRQLPSFSRRTAGRIPGIRQHLDLVQQAIGRMLPV
jgi:ketosteroid isomerase-like protein